MKYVLVAIILLSLMGCGEVERGWCLGGYQFAGESSYLKLGGVSTEMMMQPRLNGIQYDNRKFNIDILEPDGIMMGIYYSKSF